MSEIDFFISLPIADFCRRVGIGQTLCREMIMDGRLRAVRAGQKKLLVDVSSWREYMHRQAVEGVPNYDTKPANEALRQKLAEQRRTRADLKIKPKAERPGVDLQDLELL